MRDLFSLEGRTALVTGGSRGIGRMIAEGFLRQGATVFISARTSLDCITAAEEMSADGGQCSGIVQDLATLTGVRALAAEIGDRTPTGLDILVNNAGAAWAEELGKFPERGWDKVVDLNMKAPFFLTQMLLDRLRIGASPERPSKVLNIASIDALSLNPLETYSYHASKAGLIHLTRRLAAQLAHQHVTVNSIAPGAFGSTMNRPARDNATLVASHVPLGRVGRAEDMAGAAVYLASSAGDYITGITLTVDGGVAFARLPPDLTTNPG